MNRKIGITTILSIVIVAILGVSFLPVVEDSTKTLQEFKSSISTQDEWESADYTDNVIIQDGTLKMDDPSQNIGIWSKHYISSDTKKLNSITVDASIPIPENTTLSLFVCDQEGGCKDSSGELAVETPLNDGTQEIDLSGVEGEDVRVTFQLENSDGSSYPEVNAYEVNGEIDSTASSLVGLVYILFGVGIVAFIGKAIM